MPFRDIEPRITGDSSGTFTRSTFNANNPISEYTFERLRYLYEESMNLLTKVNTPTQIERDIYSSREIELTLIRKLVDK